VIALDDSTTIGDAFFRAADVYAARPFLIVPVGVHRPYHRDGFEITFAHAAREVRALIGRYRTGGYGPGHRVAMLLDNRPEHFLHKLALNAIGVSAVPINPDYRANEIYFTDALPTTGTQKIQKHQIFPAGADPRVLPGMFDLREREKRGEGKGA
jgi:crotonobetaine/carnitine-CoA ligase